MLDQTILFARRVNATRFYEGLQEGDPVAWGILIVVVILTIGSFVLKTLRGGKSRRAPIIPRGTTSGFVSAAPEPPAAQTGPKCPVCQTPVTPNPGNEITCRACQAKFPSP